MFSLNFLKVGKSICKLIANMIRIYDKIQPKYITKTRISVLHPIQNLLVIDYVEHCVSLTAVTIDTENSLKLISFKFSQMVRVSHLQENTEAIHIYAEIDRNFHEEMQIFLLI